MSQSLWIIHKHQTVFSGTTSLVESGSSKKLIQSEVCGLSRGTRSQSLERHVTVERFTWKISILFAAELIL